MGMGGSGFIPWSRIKDYAEFYGLPDKEDFISIVQAMDMTDLRTRKPHK